MLHQGLQLRTSPQLTVTPQLRQAIRLLQLSSLELDAELHQALEENVFLEAEEPVEEQPAAEEQAQCEPVVDEWQDLPSRESEVSGPAMQPVSNAAPEREQAAPAGGLAEHLAWQLGMSSLSARDLSIAEVIVDALDDDGLLACPVEELRSIVPGRAASQSEFEAVRQVILGLDPVGCGALDVSECLAEQLRRLGLPAALEELAGKVLALGLDGVAGNDSTGLAERLGCAPEHVDEALNVLRQLDPRPGRCHAAAEPEYIVPDVLVRRRSGRWVVELNPEVLPQVRVNSLYERLMAEQTEGHKAMQGQLQEARWLVRSVQMRNDTLLKVAGAIMRHQSGFLEHGEIAMRPMVLEEIAKAIEMHESTVSRVTTRKYIHTPRGIFELKYFFSSRLNTRSGGRCSSTAVRALIRRIIDAEVPGEPLSDGHIARLLSERGVRIARRTVAKYREAMGIAPLAERLAGATAVGRVAVHH